MSCSSLVDAPALDDIPALAVRLPILLEGASSNITFFDLSSLCSAAFAHYVSIAPVQELCGRH